GVSCLGFPITEAARIFAAVMCATAVIGFGFSLFNFVIYVVNGVMPWLMIAPLVWTLLQFVCFALVFPACNNKQPERIIPALTFSAFGCIGMAGLLGWSTVLVVQNGYVDLFYFDWQIGWPIIVLTAIGTLAFLYITITMAIAFKHVKLQKIEILRLAALPRYNQGDWKGHM
ncbi:hypothetical protein PFISCL1PPCAC_18570, partial [Pristionchus fissidentatus]